jgi:hypothetical protein
LNYVHSVIKKIYLFKSQHVTLWWFI